MVPNEVIASTLSKGTPPSEQAQALVDQANEHGGLDNVTAVVAHVMIARDV
jgi:serine/threonine protein phosphatase PrpC